MIVISVEADGLEVAVFNSRPRPLLDDRPRGTYSSQDCSFDVQVGFDKQAELSG